MKKKDFIVMGLYAPEKYYTRDKVTYTFNISLAYKTIQNNLLAIRVFYNKVTNVWVLSLDESEENIRYTFDDKVTGKDLVNLLFGDNSTLTTEEFIGYLYGFTYLGDEMFEFLRSLTNFILDSANNEKISASDCNRRISAGIARVYLYFLTKRKYPYLVPDVEIFI